MPPWAFPLRGFLPSAAKNAHRVLSSPHALFRLGRTLTWPLAPQGILCLGRSRSLSRSASPLAVSHLVASRRALQRIGLRQQPFPELGRYFEPPFRSTAWKLLFRRLPGGFDAPGLTLQCPVVIPRTRSNLGSALAFPVSCGGSLCLGPVFLGARRLHHNIPGFIPNRCSHLGLSTPPDQSTRFRSHPGNPPLWSARSPLAPRDGSLIRNSAPDHRSRFATFHPARFIPKLQSHFADFPYTHFAQN
jgi:hypothetical protein